MAASTADAGRALYGISKAGLTIKELGMLNRFHVPACAMTVDLVVNIALVAVHHKQPGDPVHEQHRLRTLPRVRAQRASCCCAGTGRTGRRPIKVGAGLDCRSRLALRSALCSCVVGAGSHRNLNGYGTWTDFCDRRRRARRVRAAVLLPAHRPGQGKDPLAARRRRRCPKGQSRASSGCRRLTRRPSTAISPVCAASGTRSRRRGMHKIVLGYDDTSRPSARSSERRRSPRRSGRSCW